MCLFTFVIVEISNYLVIPYISGYVMHNLVHWIGFANLF